MKCNNCGKEVSDDAKFCSECGTKIERPMLAETVSSAKITMLKPYLDE